MVHPDCSPVRCQQIESWRGDEIVALYQSAGWWRDEYDPSGIPDLIRGSYIFAVAIEEITGRAIAMGRILSDGVSVGYVQDLCVLTEYRGRSIGRFLLRFLVKSAIMSGIPRIVLIAEPGTHHFYERAGFIHDGVSEFFTITDPSCYNEN